MLRFCGFDIELTVDRVLRREIDPISVFGALDGAGDHWLICGLPGEEREATWICAPASERTVDLVSAGKAAVFDALRHSATGWVERVRVVDGHAVPDQRVACAQLSLPALAGVSIPR